MNTLEIYDILQAAQIEDGKARAITQAIEKSVEQQALDLKGIFTEHFATKKDLAEVKAELVRWMFIFWLGLIPVIAALVKFVK